jgi:hypothetical protein
MKKNVRISLAIAALLIMSQVAMAQPPPPPSSPAAVPIDGGLSLLLAAGAGLGAKKAWDARKAAKESEPEA